MKKTKVLALVLVLAFASLGGAYAVLYDHLYINATVNTSTVDVVWLDPSSSDSPPNYTGYSSEVDVSKYGSGSDRAVYNQGLDGLKRLDRMDDNNKNDPKNVGSLDAQLSPDKSFPWDPSQGEKLPPYVGTIDPRFDNDVLTITLKNGYPGYQEYITATIKNKGKIPVKFEVNPDLTAPDQNTLARKTDVGIEKWLQVKIVDFYDNNIVYFDSTNTVPSKLEGKKLNPEGYPDNTVKVKIITRILDNAPQTTTTSFHLQLRAIEWNEYGFTLPDKIQLPD
ncbi:MAG TPA: hypothetical protein VN426_09340 [Syntrophomonadaceae bacterium]|nr:hypothetical protein [Syntrophomonadaceae bacterium]